MRSRRSAGCFPLLPRRKRTDKGDYGHVLAVAGSAAMPGAAILACRAALSSGSGLVTLAAPRRVTSLASRALPEVMTLELGGRATAGISDYSRIARAVQRKKIGALLAGPGLTPKNGPASLVRRIVRSVPVSIILDADGLNAFRGRERELRRHAGALILTPHRREFERLFRLAWPAAEKDRALLAKKLAGFYDGVLVLKGHRTIVADKARFVVNKTGNPSMAKGGSGDVLTGMIAAFIVQGLRPFDAACWAVCFHGLAGDMAVRKKGELSLLPSDLIDFLPQAFRKHVSLE